MSMSIYEAHYRTVYTIFVDRLCAYVSISTRICFYVCCVLIFLCLFLAVATDANKDVFTKCHTRRLPFYILNNSAKNELT